MYNRDMVRLRLEEAGATLLSLPGGGRGVRLGSSMPAPARQAIEAYGWTEERIRPAYPGAAQITRMDEALAWVSLIRADKADEGEAELHALDGGVVLRQIVGARMLVDPITLRHLFSWRKMGKMIGADHRGVKRWHELGIGLIVHRLNEQAKVQPLAFA